MEELGAGLGAGLFVEAFDVFVDAAVGDVEGVGDLVVGLAGEEEAGQPPTLVARVVLTGSDELPQPRAAAIDPRAVQGALREAIELAVGSRMTGASPAVGYPLASWSAHERIWLTTEPGSRAEGFYAHLGWAPAGVTDKGEVRFEFRRQRLAL